MVLGGSATRALHINARGDERRALSHSAVLLYRTSCGPRGPTDLMLMASLWTSSFPNENDLRDIECIFSSVFDARRSRV